MSSAASGRPGAAAGAPPRWRFLIRPKWLGWHATMVVAAAGMCALGYWQYRRAMEGNALSWAYTFEWPIFAIFAVVFWAKTIRDEFAPPATGQPPDAATAAGPGDGQPARVGVPTAGTPAAEQDEPEDPDLAAYNAYLARLHIESRGRGRWHGLR